MKFLISLVTAILMAHAMTHFALGQEFVSERMVGLTATILTQGADASVTTVQGGTTITTKRVVSTSFANRDLLAVMQSRQLITGQTGEWSLVFLADAAGKGGLYARRPGLEPVPVPADLLSLPAFGAKVAGGMTVSGSDGGHFGGLSETAFATLAVDGVPASGLANSGVGKGTGEQGVSPDFTTTTLSFTGGIVDAGGNRLVKGVIVIGSPKNRPLAAGRSN